MKKYRFTFLASLFFLLFGMVWGTVAHAQTGNNTRSATITKANLGTPTPSTQSNALRASAGDNSSRPRVILDLHFPSGNVITVESNQVPVVGCTFGPILGQMYEVYSIGETEDGIDRYSRDLIKPRFQVYLLKI